MSRTKGNKENEIDKSPIGKKAALLMVFVIILAGIGTAAYFLMSSGPSGNVNYGDSGEGGSAETNPIAILNIRSEDGSISGTVSIELYRKEAPITVDNFIRYANAGLYNGCLFHRVEKDFVIQGGGYYPNGTHIPTYPPIPNEADNGLHNTLWTVAMARGNDPDSATSEFFINMNDNSASLDPNSQSAGYAVFGKVISGFDVVQQINEVETQPVQTSPNFVMHIPTVNIIIESVTIQGS